VKPGRFMLAASRTARTTLCHTNADQRPLESGSGTGKISRLNEATLEDSLGLSASPLRPLQIDFRSHVRSLSKDHDAVWSDLDKTTEDGEFLFLARPLHAKHALTEERNQRRVVGQYAHLTLAAGHDDLVDVTVKGAPFRSHDLQMQGHLVDSFYFVRSGPWRPIPSGLRGDGRHSRSRSAPVAKRLCAKRWLMPDRHRVSVTSPA
jgi:hypothetical protein